MMQDLIHSALLKKLNEDKLASLYLLTYNSETTSAETWAETFQKELTPLTDHPDILRVNKGPKENEYKVDSPGIKEFLAFISTRPLQLSKKFIFLFDAQDLSVIVSNKLLKVIEELGSDYCLILFAPRNASLLETVLSRAVKLSLTGASNLEGPLEVDFSGITSPQELMAFLKDCDDEMAMEKKFIEFVISKTLKDAAHQGQYQRLDQLMSALKDYEVRSAFNNSRLSRLTPFFS